MGEMLPFGTWLAQRRKALGLTQAELARQVGYSDVYVRKIEAGDVRPSKQMAERLSEHLDLSADERAVFVRFARGQVGEKLAQTQLPPALLPFPEITTSPAENFNSFRLPLPEPSQPPESRDFVGRATQLAQLANKLKTVHLAVITGFAGVGKTTLAAQLARQVADRRKIFWYVCHEGDGLETITWRLAAWLAWNGAHDVRQVLEGMRQSTGQKLPLQDMFTFLLQKMREQNYLLCLDDFHLVEEDPELAPLIEQLLREVRAGTISLILTARRLPDFAQVAEFAPLDGLTRQETLDFLLTRGLALSEELIPTLHQRTGGNAQLLTLAAVALHNTNNPEHLVAHFAAAPDIERYLMEEVYRELSESERGVMRALAVLLGYPGTRDAIEAILDQSAIQPTLNELRERHLLITSEGERGREYTQHALVQEFYYELLGRRERVLMHRRAAEFYETIEVNALQAGRHFQHAEEYARAVHRVTRDVWAIINRGQGHALRSVLEQFSASQLEPRDWVLVNLARGEVYTFLGVNAQARSSYNEAFTQLSSLPDSNNVRELKTHACRGMGSSFSYESPRQALEWLYRGLEQSAGTVAAEDALLHLRIGAILTRMGDKAIARNHLQLCLDLLPPAFKGWRARAFTNLGNLYSSQGEFQQGKEYYLDALKLYQETNDYWGMVQTWHNLGIDLEISGDWTGAATEYEKAAQLAHQLGSITPQTELQLSLGILRTKQGDFAAARAHLKKAIELAQRHSLQEHLAAAQSSHADLEIRMGEWETAAGLLRAAEQVALELENQYQLQEIYRGWAYVRLAEEEPKQALESVKKSLDLTRALNLQVEEGITRRVLAQVLFFMERADEALNSLEASLTLLADRDPYETARTELELAFAAGTDTMRRTQLLTGARHTLERLGAQRDLAILDGYIKNDL